MADSSRRFTREGIFPEARLPSGAALVAQGQALADHIRVGESVFCAHYGVSGEVQYKRDRAARGEVMLHAQIGYRDLAKSIGAYARIYEQLSHSGCRLDRYGICLDQSMGYPVEGRADMPRGTGLVLESPEQFAELTAAAPVAPHFGDFVMGMPAALDNTAAALAAGATAIGNLGQFFTFRLPGWDDEIATTSATVKALALVAAQPREVLVHSNLDDGFAALFCDLSCCLGAVLLERYIVDELLGASVSHCYGHTFSEPVKRLAFQRALARVESTPGTMVYGNTTIYDQDQVANYAGLASYLLVDVVAQQTVPSGHAVNPVPVTEAQRIPEVDEIIDAHRFAGRLIERAVEMRPLFDLDAADETAASIIAGGRMFYDRVLSGLDEAGIDTRDPFEMLLALRRIGARRLEECFGPGAPHPGRPRGRVPMVASSTLSELDRMAQKHVDALSPKARETLARCALTGCLATTDVHEYGKLLVEHVLGKLGVRVVDGGVSTDPHRLVATAREAKADFIALSTYNGFALGFVLEVRRELGESGADLPLFLGGKLNAIPPDSNSSLPVDVSAELEAAGAKVCRSVGDMLDHLLQRAG